MDYIMPPIFLSSRNWFHAAVILKLDVAVSIIPPYSPFHRLLKESMPPLMILPVIKYTPFDVFLQLGVYRNSY